MLSEDRSAEVPAARTTHRQQRMTRIQLLLALSAASTLTDAFRSPPTLHGSHGAAAAPRCFSCMTWKGDGCSDSPEFMSDPFNYIVKHPELFNEDLQKMASFQLMQSTKQFNLWGDLPRVLDENARGAASLREKNQRADELARIILCADQETMQNLADDATFEEKKALFKALSVLPESNRGMHAIHDTVEDVIDWSHEGPQARFDRDVQRVAAKVAEANEALLELDKEYSTLFLGVRKVATLSRAATKKRARNAQAEPERAA